MISPRILVVGDHRIGRQALRRLLEQHGMNVVGEAEGSAAAGWLADERCADVVVLGFTRPLSSCLSVASDILQTAPKVGVILVAFEDYLVVPAFRAGIRGYVRQTRVVEDLPLAVPAVARGGIYLSPGMPPANVVPTYQVPSGTRSEARYSDHRGSEESI